MRWRSGGVLASVVPESAALNGSGSSSADENETTSEQHQTEQTRTSSNSLNHGDESEAGSQIPSHADGSAANLQNETTHSHHGLDSSHAAEQRTMPIDDTLESNNSRQSLSEEGKQRSENADSDDRQASPKGGSGRVTPLQEEDDGGSDHAEPQTPVIPWKPQNVQSTCEFTHTITDYAKKRESGCKKAEYSATTVDDFGNRWRLIVYVNGNGRASNHHLSLFLQVADADDLPFGWKKGVSYVLTLEHPNGGSLSYAKRNPDKTFKLCPKAIDWGWSQFITSDRIQQEGFVSDDSLTVRASVTVKSSSVSIDEEDSELYLKCAVEEGDADAVKLCLDQGASVNCKFKDDLYTPLHTACSSGTNTGSMEVLNLLLENGADGNACNKWRETPLLIAANNGHLAAVEALLRHGADPSLCSEAGWSALTFAAHKGFGDIVTLLLNAGAPVNCRVTEDASTPLHKACAGSKDGHLPSVKLLLAGGADVHALNKWRETPLLTAANHGQAGAVEALLLGGADPCKCTDTGWSPLSIAAYKGHDDVVRLLLEESAPTEEEDPTLSALLQAATKGLPDTVELLLRHGADHTVTTKKGDTALSILVEQNLIDAAVEMVTEYSASIPRCSRDRKKVQRARLLINLRMKQLEREGNNRNASVSTDDETDNESDEAKLALHEENAESPASQSSRSQKKKTRQKSKVSAEKKAREAEEALLLELEQEDAKAKKEQADADSKRAKKRKKKERERQNKMKEEKERRLREEREAKERERLKKEKEEKERKAREQRLKEEREREMKEHEKFLASKRKERERRDRDQKEREKQSQKEVAGPASPSGGSSPSDKVAKSQKTKKALSSVGGQSNAQSNNTHAKNRGKASASAAPGIGNRRWETDTKSAQLAASEANQKSHSVPSLPFPGSESELSNSIPALSTRLSPRPRRQASTDTTSYLPFKENEVANTLPSIPGAENGAHSKLLGGSFEHPMVALCRRDKVLELLEKCKGSFSAVGEDKIKRVLHRWCIRASHGQTPSIDPIIPSAKDVDSLVAYFHRQFISESRRRTAVSSSIPKMASIEALKEAGSSMAMLCQSTAEVVAQLRQKVEEQLPPDWTDSALGMTVSDGTQNGSGSVVILSWADRANVYIPSLTFTALRDRYVGPINRFLTATFVAKTWYDTKRLVVAGSVMDFRLSPAVQTCLSTEVAVSAELWSDPFSAPTRNVFWGNFEEVDCLFGGQKPFGKDEHGGEEVLARHGGSISVLLPFDMMVASSYVKRMFDILDSANSRGVAVSFAVFVHAECFHDLPEGPSPNDLHILDPRLVDPKHGFVKRVEVLRAGEHVYHCGEGTESSQVSMLNSLLVMLQSETGFARFNVKDSSMSKIIGSMSMNPPSPNVDSIVSSIGFSSDFAPRESPVSPRSGHFDLAPNSPNPQLAVQAGFGAIGGSAISNTFSPKNDSAPRASRHGRLFELVDDGEEDHSNEVDIVSGMLNGLGVGLFQNNNTVPDVDIEAFSLMGIGGAPSQSVPRENSHSRLGPQF